MKATSFIAFLIIFNLFYSCANRPAVCEKSSPEEYLKSVTSNPIIYPGVGVGKLRIEETRGEYLFNETINGRAYMDLNIYLKYREADTLTGITISDKRIYRYANGKKIGLNKDEIIKELGKPKSIGTPISKGEKNEIGSLPTLNYDGISFLFNDDSERTIFIWKEK